MKKTSLNEEPLSLSEKEEYENKDNIIVICFDPDNETKDLKKQLCQMNNYVFLYTELESCIHFIKSIKKENTFLVTSYSHVSQLSHIDIFRQVDFIFIFCSKQNESKYLFHEDLNIISVYDKLLGSPLQELFLKFLNSTCRFFFQSLQKWSLQ